MQNPLSGDLLAATRLTRSGRLTEATAILQRLLGRAAADATPARRGSPTINGVAEAAGIVAALAAAKTRPMRGEPGPLPDPVRFPGFPLPGGGRAHSPPGVVADGATFLTAMFSGTAGSRPYKLYVPSTYHGQSVPLIVMLHGCTQSPDDFAAGTRMNERAESNACLVAYPEQTGAANLQKCWNWFREGDQRRDAGEPSLIAGITREVMRDYAVDPRRVYVAGLSAGGAAAAVMGEAYPDLYAAIGVHSGLACGAARDMPSAFAAMQQGAAPRSGTSCHIVPAIVFHGDGDTTVHPRNGDAVIAQSTQAAALRMHSEDGRVPGGHTYRRMWHTDANGRTLIEQWVIHGAGHAWSGGNPAGSYTDPRGPDATTEMLRFFLEHPHPTVRAV